jgi:ribosomal protein S18 acetylase RimI-like enzyme
VSDVEIRIARHDEFAAAGEIAATAYVASGLVDAGDPYLDSLRDAERRGRDAELWVAVMDGVVIGSVAFCSPDSPLTGVARDHEGEFRMLAVDSAVQGRGVAQSLIGRCIQRCRDLGLSQLCLSTLPDNARGIALYEFLGFKRDVERDREIRPGVDLIAYRLPIDQSIDT